MAAKQCSCGQKIEDNSAQFCAVCGEPVSDEHVANGSTKPAHYKEIVSDHTVVRSVWNISFILCGVFLVLFALVGVLAIWQMIGQDVAWRSVATLALLFFVTMIGIRLAKLRESR